MRACVMSLAGLVLLFGTLPARAESVTGTGALPRNVCVQRNVRVPDGGFVFIGGLRTLRDARNEFGPPVLSNIRLRNNRLFINVPFGRDSESLMLMVTPRIIISEEEEERATGLRGGG